jgi:hypothetical protein
LKQTGKVTPYRATKGKAQAIAADDRDQGAAGAGAMKRQAQPCNLVF